MKNEKKIDIRYYALQTNTHEIVNVLHLNSKCRGINSE